MKAEALDAINYMKQHADEWAVRDTLIKFTNWDFYKGEWMVSIDTETAKNICNQLAAYVKEMYDGDIELEEVYKMIEWYIK